MFRSIQLPDERDVHTELIAVLLIHGAETYCTLIPAILMGNCVVMKLPRVGVLCHIPTLELFKVHLL